MTTPTVVVEADWGRTGLYDHASADITADVIAVSMDRGRDYASQLIGRSVAGRCSVELVNTTGKYSRSNASGTLYGLLEPGVPVRVRVTAPTATVLWAGFLATVEASDGEMIPGEARKARLTASGPLGRLRKLGTVNVVPQTTVLTGEALGVVWDAAGWPAKAQPYLTGLSPAAQWGLGAASGTEADLSGNANTGTVTIGGGSRDYAALDDAGDGCIDFDGAATLVTVADAASIQNVFDGGGAAVVMFNADSDGEGDVGRLVDKAGWYLNVQNESGGFVRLNFRVGFSGTEGIWQSAVDVPISTSLLAVVSYNADDVANNPTIYLFNLSTGALSTLTVGAGLTETSTPVGTRTTDVASTFTIGNNAAGGATFDGRIDEVALISAAAGLTLAQVKTIASRVHHSPRVVDAGQTELPVWWVERLNALSASADLEETERGFISEGRAGALVYEDRHHRLKGTHLDSQATFSDASGASLPYSSFVPRDVDAEIFNKVEIPVRHFTEQALAVLWTYRGDSPVIEPGASLELWANYPGAATPAGRYVAAWTTPVVGTDVTQTGVANGDIAVAADKFAQSMKITITNNHATTAATLTLVQARGTGVTEDEPTIVKSEDTTSSDPDTGFGERTVPRVGAWHQDITLAQAIADYMVSRYSLPLDPIPISISYEATRSAGLMTEALTRDLSDHITVVANDAAGVALGISGDYYVEGIRIVITKSRTQMRVTYDLSPTTGDGGYWAIGEVGYSELGETTKLAPP